MSEKARVHYWLDRDYVPNHSDTMEACVAKLQRQFPGIMKLKLQSYVEEYLEERERR